MHDQGKNKQEDHTAQRLHRLPENIPSDLPLSETGHRERFAGGIIGSKEQRAPFFPEPPVGRTIKEEHLPLPF